MFRVIAEIDIDHRDIKRPQFFDVIGFFDRLFDTNIQKHHVGFLRDGFFNINQALFKPVKNRDIRKFREFCKICLIGCRIGFDQILAPTDNAFGRVFAVQCRDDIKLPAFTQNGTLHRYVHRDLATCDVRNGYRFRLHNGARHQQHTHRKDSL